MSFDIASIPPVVGAGIEFGSAVLGIVGRYLAGKVDPAEVRTEMLAETERFYDFIRLGGEMDQRRDAARANTDAAIAQANALHNRLKADDEG
jgi:hypothetical protein